MRGGFVGVLSCRFYGGVLLACVGAQASVGLVSPSAAALEIEENATTRSSDAFGRKVGNEESGLYSDNEIRGFNPVDAGNVRIEGLYADLIDRIPSRLVSGSTVRVGFSAVGYPLPAPTGLVDFDLLLTPDETATTIEIDNGNSNVRGEGATVKFGAPLGRRGLRMGAAATWRNTFREEGGRQDFSTYATSLSYRPDEAREYILFAGGTFLRSKEARATYFPAGDMLPPRVPRYTYLGQPWTGSDIDSVVHGFIAKTPLGRWRVEAGVFRGMKYVDRTYFDSLLGVSQDGQAADRLISLDRDNRDRSLSGEARLLRSWRTDSFDHSLTLSLRGRDRSRAFGGGDRVSLGSGSAIAPDFRTEPEFSLKAKNHDRSKQIVFGAAYGLVWSDIVTLDFGVSKSKYRKDVDFADDALADPVSRSDSLLWNVLATVSPWPGVSFYAGATTGLEEALIAPDIATNRAEAPPAIDTRQINAGVRIAIKDRLSVMAGAFSISKPYYNLDPLLRYRNLGDLTNRGVELSLAGSLAPGWTIVAGAVFLDPSISGEAVETGLIGERPVGQWKRRSILNLDWRTQSGAGPLSLDLRIEDISSVTANALNTFEAPQRTRIDFGGRYRFDVGSAKVIMRLLLANAFNGYGWQVSPSGGFTASMARTAVVAFTVGL